MIIGISGGTGSGKTTVARRILENVSDEQVVFLQQDSYYRNLEDMPIELRHQINFDHPDALDNDLFVNHVKALRAGEPIKMPVYDFATHTRKAETVHIEPKPILIIEGILVFVDAALRGLMDVKIFVDTDDDLRFIRRLQRDVRDRGRSVDSVIKQYLETVRPMHQQFVEPSKRHADVIIPEGGHNDVGIDLIAGKIRAKLQEELARAVREPVLG
jgi:uridine kinase